MRYVIHFEAARTRDQAILHAWDPGGDVRDVSGRTSDHRHFTFELDMDTTDPRDIAFKFWFPGSSQVWEADGYTRHLPDDAEQVWTFDFSSRCLTRDPEQGATCNLVTVFAITRSRYKGGAIYVWNPAGTESERFPETERDAASETSTFLLTVRPWMNNGFHFKLVSARGGSWEPDQSSRVWRPADGPVVWIKSGLVELYTARPALQSAAIELWYPRAVGRPKVRLRDTVWDYEDELRATDEQVVDADFARCRYDLSVYPDAAYRISATASNANCLDLPYTLRSSQAGHVSYGVAGVYRWLEKRPERDAWLELEIHPNPNSGFGDAISVAWRPGEAPRTSGDSVLPACLRAEARRLAGQPWKTRLQVFSRIPHYLDLFSSIDGRLGEARRDGPVRSKRVAELKPGETRVLYTGDGLSGLGLRPPSYQDLGEGERRQWMRRAYTSNLVDPVFSPHELPHGATKGEGEWLFVLFAPHAVSVDLLVLDRRTTRGARRTTTVAMELTADLRYWWCKVPDSRLPEPNNVRYRFLLNGSQEVIDPASRSLTPAPYLWAAPGEGAEGCWSVAVDTAALRVKGNGWQTPGYSEFIIYELHPLRFSRRTDAPAFDRLVREVGSQGYLAGLDVTALELLPIHEFPKEISWGYNPSGFFAIESSYGGPEGFSRMVEACHQSGKAVMLDLVFNHLVESPMQEIAADVFVDGETQWGDMVNYDHPVCLEFFRQAHLYLWDTFRLDGFRFDATEAIVNGHIDNGYIVRDHHTGSGRGWEFLVSLKHAIEAAANACGRRWPYRVCENDPCNEGMLGHCVDGEWDFWLQYPLGECACNKVDKTDAVRGVLQTGRIPYQVVRYAESHDAVSEQDDWKRRMVRREAWGFGVSMAKATGATVLLAEGVPMLFMGQEAAEARPFYFDMPSLDQDRCYLDLDHYLDPDTPNHNVLRWFRHLIGLRKNLGNGLTGDDQPVVGRGYKTLAFTRAGGRFFVIATFGTSDTRQNLGWLGLPGWGSYKEILNSTWEHYWVPGDSPVDNGGSSAHLTADRAIQLPPIGALVLERN